MPEGTTLEGTIYIFTNPAMPGIVKIGKTKQVDIQIRMKELYTTGVPFPFECEYAALVGDVDKVENALHIAFNPDRINVRREFFEIEADQAIAIIKLLEINAEQVNTEQKDIDTIVDREASRSFVRKRHPNTNFIEMNIPLGSNLVFYDGVKTATVVSERQVEFEGETLNLRNATRRALGNEEAGGTNANYYWRFNGERLKEIYDNTYKSYKLTQDNQE